MFTLARRIRARLSKLQAVRRPEARRRLADQFLRADIGELVAGPPGSTWFHSAPTPDGRRLVANTSDPLREQKLWEACFDDDRDVLLGRRVLDVGAGDGFFSVAATLCGARSVHAVDLGPPANPGFPANLRWLSRVWGVGPAVTVGDFLSLPADGPKYDVILLFGVLEHFDDLFAGMRKVADLLAPVGGSIWKRR
ncbi:MAG: class I SAM-dependent methyltransferase [Gemmataceae bacterium]